MAGVGLRARLLALTMLPTLLVALLSGGFAYEAKLTADEAVQAQRDAQAVLVLGRMRTLVALEHGMALGLRSMAEFNLSPATLALLYGLRIDASVASVRAEIEAASGELAQWSAPEPELVAALAALRPLPEEASALRVEPAEIDRLYADAEEAIDTARDAFDDPAAARGRVAGQHGADLTRAVRAADALGRWMQSGADLTRLLSITARPRSTWGDQPTVLLEVGSLYRHETDAWAELRASAGPQLAAALDANGDIGPDDQFHLAQRQALRYSGLLLDEAAAADPNPTDWARNQSLVSLASYQFDRLDPFELWTPAARDAEVAAAAMVRDAKRAAAFTVAVAAVLLAACTGWALVLARSMLVPLRKVALGAAAVRDGDLHGEPLGALGPPEVAGVAATIDELTANLRLLEAQAEALSAARLADPVLRATVPGRLGASFQGSIERLSEVTERLALQARVDPMTGLANRAAAIDRLAHLLGARRRVAVLFIDLDGFKAVNDSFGHAAGDRVLIEVAHRLEGLLVHDQMAARLGGDEFLLLLPGADDEQAEAVANTVIAAVSVAIADGDHRYNVAASVGVALGDSGDAQGLIRDADQATYRAKEMGKGRVQFFDVELRRKLEERALLQQQIRQAIDEGQFELYVQPVVRLTDNTVTGGEALVRWNRPGRGVVLPGAFIPVAEESWLIVELGQFMLRQACRLLTVWAAEGRSLHLSVNVSGRHVVDGAFVRDVRQALEMSGADPHGLVLEITESHLLTDLDTAAAALGELRELGVRVALDDFGTGYASLSYLRQLPIDIMKIDRAYVKDVLVDPTQAPILDNLIKLSNILGLDVVAEGVETEGQLDMLRAMGCAYVQGYLLGRPMTVEAFERYLAHPALPGLDVHAAGTATSA